MPATVNPIAFGVLAALILWGAIMMLTSRNVVHAAFWMLETMIATAGLYLLLSAEFIALVQLMIYAGAVAVLMLFVIMITLRRREDAIRPIDFSMTALALAASFGAIVYATLLQAMPRSTSEFPAEVPGVADLGRLMFALDGPWVVPFEIASLVLLVALVGAVWWAMGGDRR